MTPDEKIRAMLDERGIDYQIYDGSSRICFYFDYSEQCGDFLKSIDVIGACVIASQSYLTPEQAIAATVGNSTDLSKRLREVHGLHAFAELFGFSWGDESDWDWHDVACAMADAIDATAGAKTSHAVACNVTDCIHNRECLCTCGDLEIQDQECMTYRYEGGYDEEEE